jgi:hypothetical protein
MRTQIADSVLGPSSDPLKCTEAFEKTVWPMLHFLADFSTRARCHLAWQRTRCQLRVATHAQSHSLSPVAPQRPNLAVLLRLEPRFHFLFI